MVDKELFKQIIGYGIAASLGLVVDFGVVIILTEVISLHYLVSVSAGFIFGLIVTYLISKKYIFGEPKDDSRRTFILFGVIGLVGLCILNLLVWTLTEAIGLNYLLSKVIATVVVFIWNFSARKILFYEK